MRRKGSLSVELTVTITLMILLTAVLAETMFTAGKSNRIQWARRECLNAAAAQLDSFTASGKPLDSETFERLWPNLRCSIRTGEGHGDWQGLMRIEVEISRRVQRKEIIIVQSRYVGQTQ